MADIAQESAAEQKVEATKEACTDKTAEVAKHTDAEETAKTTGTSVDEASEATEEPESTGVKRKSEDDEEDLVKKSKKESGHGDVELREAEEPTLVSNGDKNGCGEGPKHVEGGKEDGQAAGEVPPGIVTKTVDEAVNLTEDVAASS